MHSQQSTFYYMIAGEVLQYTTPQNFSSAEENVVYVFVTTKHTELKETRAYIQLSNLKYVHILGTTHGNPLNTVRSQSISSISKCIVEFIVYHGQ